MVVFTCGHCGESLQKPKVEKHYLTKCRNRSPNLSCMDCFKDFLGNDYEAHNKCITEEERYSGKGFTPKEKKGEKKQNAWVEMLQSVLDESKTTSSNVLRIIETISKHNNTPRKKPKFINFVKNVCGQKTNPKDIDQAWDLISVKLTALSNFNGQNKNQNQNNEETKINGKSDDNEQDGSEEGKESENKENNEAEKNIKPKINGQTDVSEKKLSKKERKEEKKRRKYEAELQSAEQQPSEETHDEVQSKKKGKKNKNKVNGTDKTEDEHESEEKNKIKKRKRQDTVNTIPEVVENEIITENITNKIKVQQKKQRVQEEEDSASLHDQNVAKNEEPSIIKEKFDWHAVIISVLQKKDNEVPFKRLQKKVLSEYSEITGYEIDDRIADKFIKKLKSAPNVRVDKNRVLLVEESND